MPMPDTMLDQAAKLGKTKRRKKTWRSIVLAMAAVVVFCTTYALILPAITMEAETFCGEEEHVHGDDCYTVELIPQKVTFTCEGLICGHVHSELCRDGDGELICPLPERVTRGVHAKREGAHLHRVAIGQVKRENCSLYHDLSPNTRAMRFPG